MGRTPASVLLWLVVASAGAVAAVAAALVLPAVILPALAVLSAGVGALLWANRSSGRLLLGWRLLAAAASVLSVDLLLAALSPRVTAVTVVVVVVVLGLLVSGSTVLVVASGVGSEVVSNLVNGAIAVLAVLALLSASTGGGYALVGGWLAVPTLVVVLGVVVALQPALNPVAGWSSSILPALGGAGAVTALLLAVDEDITTHVLAVSALVLWSLSGWLRGRVVVGLAAARTLAESDDLTGLPNRRRLDLDLEGLLYRLSPAGLVLLDLDDFKTVNDSLGHPAGDQLLREVARVTQQVVGERATVYRLGGDEFVVLVPGADLTGTVDVAVDVSAALGAPLDIDGVRIRTRASLGVACLPEHGSAGVELMQRADQAMYLAKKALTSTRIAVADPGPAHEGLLRTAFDLGRSLAGVDGAGRLEVRYRPVLSLPVRRPGGTPTPVVVAVDVEATWHRVAHGDEGAPGLVGVVPSGATATGSSLSGTSFTGTVLDEVAVAGRLTSALTDAVTGIVVADLRAALDAARLRPGDPGLRLPPVVLRISPTDLADSRLGPRLRSVVERGLRPGAPRPTFGVAVREDAVMANSNSSLPAVRALRQAGLDVHLTRFGTGRSSLARLREMPLTAVRLDPVLLRQDPLDPTARSRRFLSAVAELAQCLGVSVIAEGVDEQDQLALLAGTGVDGVSGAAVSGTVGGPELLGLLVRQAPVQL